MLIIKLLKELKKLVSKANPIERMRFIHTNGQRFFSTNGHHFLMITNPELSIIDDSVIDVHKIISSAKKKRQELYNKENNITDKVVEDSFDDKTEIGITYPLNSNLFNFDLIDTSFLEGDFEHVKSDLDMQRLITKGLILINEHSDTIWYLDMINYFGVLKGLQALKFEWHLTIDTTSKVMKLEANSNNIQYEYYLILKKGE